VAIYAALGFIAAATGGGFNTVMRSPVVILGVAMLFAILGLSMLGLFEIQLPAALASRVDSGTSKRGGLFGTWLMGIGAGLVVSPCVGPVVVFVLTQIAAQVAAAEAGGGGALATTAPLLYGAYLMAGYGAGLAIPFWLVGLFSARTMARPGGWMVAVRVALGLLILYFAYDSFLKALDTAGVEPELSRWMVVGVVSIFMAVYWGAFRTHIEAGPHAGWQKVRLACSIVLLVAGVFFLWTSLARSGLVGGAAAGPPAPSLTSTAGFEDSHGLRWHRDLAAASAEARERGVPVFLDFYADWCANCKVFGKQAASDGPLRVALETVVRVKIHDTDAVFQQFVSDPRYPELKVGLPFFAILSSSGELLWKGTDYRAHATFIREIEKARARERA
jgi:thiol:disulfide interchange protein DsbD